MCGIIKFRTVLVVCLLLAFCSAGYTKEGPYVGKIGSVNKGTKEITVNTESDKGLKLDDQVYVRVDGKPVIMRITFPMLTVSKSKLEKGYEKYLESIAEGMSVYKYNKKLLAEKDKDSVESGLTGKNVFDHHVITGEWECTSSDNRFGINIIWNSTKNRYEGFLTTQYGSLGKSSDYGYYSGELIYIAYPAKDNPYILKEQGKIKTKGCCLLMIPPGEQWNEGMVDVRAWKSKNDGLFYSSSPFVRNR